MLPLIFASALLLHVANQRDESGSKKIRGS